MSDIFISYASEDHDTAQRLAAALEAQGWSVWWDRTIPAGSTFVEVIDEAIARARCIVVAWSGRSISKNWVLEEAQDGLDRGILVPVFIERVTPPRGFRRIQAADLSGWDGSPEAPAFRHFVRDLIGILGPPPGQAQREAEAPPQRMKVERPADAPVAPHVEVAARPEPAARTTPKRRSARRIIAAVVVLVAGVSVWVAVDAWRSRELEREQAATAQHPGVQDAQGRRDAEAAQAKRDAEAQRQAVAEAAKRQAEAEAPRKAAADEAGVRERDPPPRVQGDASPTGAVPRGWLGVRVQAPPQDIAKSLGLAPKQGALVSAIEPSGAGANAGIEVGDVILAVDGRPVEAQTVARLIAGVPAGTAVTLTVKRRDATVSIKVTPGRK